MMLVAVPVKIAEAKSFVENFHRHAKAPVSALFAVGVSDGAQLVGVAMVGRPVARVLDDGETAEVIRCCVIDSAPRNASSFLYGRCWQAARALGWRRLVTYTLQTESGASLRGAGWRTVAELRARDPAHWQSRPGREWQTVVGQAKFRWEIAA